MTFPMLADFALRLACGLAAMLLMTPWRVVPPPFFRTQAQIILGLLVLAALDASRVGVGGFIFAAIVLAAVLSYVAAFVWGVGLPKAAIPVTVAIVVACAGDLIAVSESADYRVWSLNGAGRLASAFLMGATLAAMLLGHHYLTAPAMSIDPLKRFVKSMAWGLGMRTALAAVGLCLWWSDAAILRKSPGSISMLFLSVRWGMGVLGPTVAAILTWKTVQIRSTQSATGILYIAMTLVLFGELMAMLLSREAGIVF